MALQLIAAPAVEPLTLAEVKKHLRVIDDDEDDLISLYITAARAHVDGESGFLGRALVTQTWELVLDRFPVNEIRVPLPPLQSVVFIKYDDPGGVEQVVSPSDYFVDTVSEPGWIVPVEGAAWPSTISAVNSVRVRFVAGYPPTSDSPPDLIRNVPYNVKAAMLLLIGGFYANRENTVVGTIVNNLPFGVESLLRPDRVKIGMA